MTEGAYLIDRIRHKCREDGGCLIWTGDVSSDSKNPRIHSEGKRIPLRPLLWAEKHGEPKRGNRIGVSCKTERCIEPEHLVQRTRSQELKGVRRSPATKAKMSAAKRAKSQYTPELIQMIRESDKSHVALAKELGMNYQTVAKFRRQMDYVGNPFVGLMA